MQHRWIGCFLVMMLVFSGRVVAQGNTKTIYDIGSPTLTTLYVSPSGDDGHDAMCVARALLVLSFSPFNK